MKKFFMLIYTLAFCTWLMAENTTSYGSGSAASVYKTTVSGYVKDSKNGEALIGVTIFVKELNVGVASNLYGYYSLNLKPGNYTLEYTYIGYSTIKQKINVETDHVLNIELSETVEQLDEVVITSDRPQDKINRAEMSVEKIGAKEIKKIPALMGEVDVIKVIQMMPGVISTSEGTSGFSVRGGGIDQNLIILDEATVYNASHLMGFFSVFNNDAIREVKLYKGDMPANYGGRLSSVLDVRMKEGNSKKWTATGGLGLISSRLTLEGPVDSAGRTSVLLSGRRTYADIFFPLGNEQVKDAILYFYDFNLKVSTQINQKNKFFLSGYLGRDIFGQEGFNKISFGNKTATLRWNHQFSPILFSNVTGIVSNYDYHLNAKFGRQEFTWNSNLLDYSAKIDFNLYPDPRNEVKFGGVFIRHEIVPIDAWIDTDLARTEFPRQDNYEHEYAFYIANLQKIGDRLTLKYGIRYSLFQNIGKQTLNKYDENYNSLRDQKKTIGWDKIFNTYDGFEPRLGANYNLDEYSSIKASYSRSLQYLQLASNSNGGMPLDYWFASNPNVKPQEADQVALGYIRNLWNNKVEFSVEGFYKDMNNVVDFKDHAELFFTDELDGQVRSGKAKSYGMELMVKKNEGKLTGWVSYTFSRAKRTIEGINNGKEYSAPYDKPHNISIVANYELNKRVSLSANWVYATGTPITFPVGSYSYNNNNVPIYSSRNSSRMRDYHRLDLSASIKQKDKTCLTIPYGKELCWQGEWVFSVYNAYGRHNDWIINFTNIEKDDVYTEFKKAERTYLPFLFFPGITYNFIF